MELCNERHERSRKAICLLCFAPSERVIQKDSNLERLVREFVITGYFVEDQRLPCALCASCRKKLQQFHKGNFDRYLSEFLDYTKMKGFHLHRRQSNEEQESCDCYICDVYSRSSRFGAKSMKLKVRTCEPSQYQPATSLFFSSQDKVE